MTANESGSVESDALEMFFNDDFIPHAYLDALFDSTLAPKGATLNRSQLRQKLDSVATLQLLQSKCSGLLAHLDYYTKELSGDLEDRIKKLQSSSTVITGGGQDGAAQAAEAAPAQSTTRLEYYVESLSSSIAALHEDLEVHNRQISQLQISAADAAVLSKLGDLKKIKARMLAVLKIFETAKVVATTSQLEDDTYESRPGIVARTSNRQAQRVDISLDAFTKSVYLLEGAIDDELKTKNADVIFKKIDNLASLLPLFKNLPKFYTVYAGFVAKIVAMKPTV